MPMTQALPFQGWNNHYLQTCCLHPHLNLQTGSLLPPQTATSSLQRSFRSSPSLSAPPCDQDSNEVDTWTVTKWYQHHYQLFSLKTFVTCPQSPSRGRKVALWTTIMPEPAQARLTSSQPPATTWRYLDLWWVFCVLTSSLLQCLAKPRRTGRRRRSMTTLIPHTEMISHIFQIHILSCKLAPAPGSLNVAFWKNLSYRTGVLSFVLPLNLLHIDKVCVYMNVDVFH